jgi:hypothetical protein
MLEKLRRPQTSTPKKPDGTRTWAQPSPSTRDLRALMPAAASPPTSVVLSQRVGHFPREVELRIRHDQPALGLDDVAFQRRHQGHAISPAQYGVMRRQIDDGHHVTKNNNSSNGEHKGVLSLGIPPHLINMTRRKKKMPTTLPSHMPSQTDLDDDEEEDEGVAALESAADVLSVSRNSSSSGHSSGRYSSAEATMAKTLPNRGPPPRHLLPATLSPCPPVKMHPFVLPMQMHAGRIMQYGIITFQFGMQCHFSDCHFVQNAELHLIAFTQTPDPFKMELRPIAPPIKSRFWACGLYYV